MRLPFRSTDESTPPDRAHFWLLLALAPLFVRIFGYAFAEMDQNEQLPMILRALDPGYLSRDWVVNSNQGFNHRWFFTEFMALSSRLLTLEGACYLFFILSILVWSLGMAAFFREVWAQSETTEKGAVLAAAIMLFCEWGSISSDVFQKDFVPASLAWPAMVVFAVLLRRGQLRWAAVLLLLTGLLHALIGPCSGFFLLAAQWYAMGGKEGDETARRALVRHLPLFAIGIIVPLGIAALSTRGAPLSPAKSRQVLDLLVYTRHPWHYAAFLWPGYLWLSLLSWLGFVLVARQGGGASRYLDGLIGIVLLFCLSGLAPFFVAKLYPLVKLQHFRMTIWLEIAGTLYVANWLARLWGSESVMRRIAAFVMALGLLSHNPLATPDARVLLLPVGAALFLVLDTLAQKGKMPSTLPLLPLLVWLPYWALRKYGIALMVEKTLLLLFIFSVVELARRPGRTALRLAQSGAALGFALLFLAYFPRFSPRPKLTAGVRPRVDFANPQGQLFQWVSRNTPPDALFVAPPQEEDFRLKANRAIIVSFKVFPWTDAGFLEWRGRLDELCGDKHLSLGYDNVGQLNGAYDALTPTQVKNLAHKYGAAYLVTTAHAQADFSLWPLLYRSKAGSVYRVPT